MRKTLVVTLATVAISVAALAGADGHADPKQIEAAVKARQAHMQLYSFHLATLGGMAKGEIAYDAEAAGSAADALASLVQLPQGGYWLPGSDNASIENTRALPAIWAADSKVGEAAGAMVEAAMAMQAAAGTDLAALQGAIGAVGEACGGCHKPYRASAN